MSDIRVREFNCKKDFWKIFDIYFRIWFKEDKPKQSFINYLCTFKYVIATMSKGSHALCAVNSSDQAVGFAILSNPNAKGLFKSKIFKAFLKCAIFFSAFLLYILPGSKVARLIEERYIANYARLQKLVLNPQDPELKILIVDPDCKGKGVGKILIKHAQELFKAEGAKSYYLLTDSGCDYHFYDHLKMSKDVEVTMDFAPEINSKQTYKLSCMIYSQKLDS